MRFRLSDGEFPCSYGCQSYVEIKHKLDVRLTGFRRSYFVATFTLHNSWNCQNCRSLFGHRGAARCWPQLFYASPSWPPVADKSWSDLLCSILAGQMWSRRDKSREVVNSHSLWHCFQTFVTQGAGPDFMRSLQQANLMKVSLIIFKGFIKLPVVSVVMWIGLLSVTSHSNPGLCIV